ncbi:hypothetical protein I350_03290 [Cryptococcus amylolentus CBS 6273]|uniref:Uncharacterized protein n=1 Tax=Cryptococcus amylolentus CBS 6273 TaxID=1296118 RepID=A0A1E3K4A7_9TREE|nr:hypothetical protein I350_03290 [Cryptococcus amylolentus CBS 6273]
MSTLSIMPSSHVGPTDISRRPSPWHDIAHSLSAASLPPSHHDSTPSIPSTPSTASNPSTPPNISSLALREWEQRLSHPASSATRHQLVHPRRSPTPKLAAERDKMGFIEYKLKLIDPTTERFERLVTQMMWRLKQGKNEAIYEFGLADDGTVVGLTRVEMDSSLRTLELMASEVGATVIILKEIVLSAASISSRSATAIESISLPPSTGLPVEWIARRPDLDENGQPRKGNKNYDQGPKGRRAKKVEKQFRHDRKKEKKLKEKGSGLSDTDSSFFDMNDLGPQYSPPSSAPAAEKGVNQSSLEVSDKKRRRSAARQEKRRLDLLRGDGTNPLFSDESSKIVMPHQPARPSSLRLATPAEMPEDSFGDDLLHIPLDSLSLSFADVRTVASPTPSSSASLPRALSPLSAASDAEMVLPLDDPALASSTIVPPPVSEELICVEALVVRKVQHGHGGEGEDEDGEGDDSEEWGYGGEEDVWGFGLEDD